MFYSRPDLAQLGIDLVEFEGGGSLPSQFWGRSADGRPLYVRYRQGWLTIYSGPPGTSAGDANDVLVQANIGWMGHGTLLKEQVCDLAGLTIRGKPQTLSDEELRAAAEFNDVRDWSGRTTYWVRNVFASEEGSYRLTHELKAAFPSMRILETNFRSFKRQFVLRDSLQGTQLGVTFGFDADEGQLAKILDAEHVKLAELDQVFAHRLDFRFKWNFGVRMSPSRYHQELVAKYGGNIEFHPDGNLLGLGSLRTRFTTKDPLGRAYIEKLIKIVEGCCSNWFEDVDLATGKAIGVRTIGNWYINDIRDWCASAPNRYFFGRLNADDSGQDIGTRPCFPPK